MRGRSFLLIILLLTAFQRLYLDKSVASMAGEPPFQVSSGIADRELHRQQEEERLRSQERKDAQPDVQLQPQAQSEAELNYPENETPCFVIKEIVLEGEMAEKFQWALVAVKDAIGRCLGSRGINVVMRRVQNAIVARGFITSRIVASPQDIASGRLVLTLVPGKISGMGLSDDSSRYIFLPAAMHFRHGELFNLRKMEQGLENLRRIPSAETEMELVPGENQGESFIKVKRKQHRPIRVGLGIDDAGSRYTGKVQGNVTLAIDNLFGMSDLFSVTVNSNLEADKPYGAKGYGFHYSVPFGSFLLSANTDSYDYHQVVAGAFVDYRYSGESRNSNVELSRVMFRSGVSKTSLRVGGYVNTSRNYIDDTELEIQRRRMSGWSIGINHRQYIKKATLDFDLDFRHGTGAFAAIPAPEELVDEGNSRPRILNLNIRFNMPFQIRSQQFRLYSTIRQQWAFNRLVSRDRLAIGGRYTVRGYDGETSLMADNGLVSRNELGWTIPKLDQELYMAFDYGTVYGPFDEYLLGKTLTGAALGLRGAVKRFSYDVFISKPISRPEHFPGERWVAGFSAYLQF